MSARSIARARSAAGRRARVGGPTLDGFHLAIIAIVIVGIGLIAFARAYRVGHKAVDAPVEVTATTVVETSTTVAVETATTVVEPVTTVTGPTTTAG